MLFVDCVSVWSLWAFCSNHRTLFQCQFHYFSFIKNALILFNSISSNRIPNSECVYALLSISLPFHRISPASTASPYFFIPFLIFWLNIHNLTLISRQRHDVLESSGDYQIQNEEDEKISYKLSFNSVHSSGWLWWRSSRELSSSRHFFHNKLIK